MLSNLSVILAPSAFKTSAPRCASARLVVAAGLIAGAFLLLVLQPAKAENAATPIAIASQKIAAGQMLNGRFLLNRHLAGFSRELQSEGTFTLVPDKGLIWRVATPFASTAAITPNGILQLTGGEEAMRLPASSQPGLSQLFTVLSAAVSGDVAHLEQLFTVRQSGTADQWKIVLEPLAADAGKVAQVKSLTLNGSTHVETADIDKGGGDTDRIVFSGQTITPSTLSADDVALLETLDR